MRYVTAWIAAIVCAGLGSTSIIAAFAPPGTIEVNVSIDWQVNQRPVAPTFVGVSASAGDHGNGVALQGVSTSAASSTAEVRANMLRFPDDISQSYHWEAAPAEGFMDTFEMWSLADTAQIPNIMLTVNMVSGTADEAARWVAYCNQPSTTTEGTKRQARGSTDPFNVHYWLLGEDLRNATEKYPTPEAYALSAVQNATRMKAASPGIEVGVWLDDNSTPGGDAWNELFLAALRQLDPGQNNTTSARLIDFVAVEARVEVPDRPLTDGALYPSLYGYAAERAEAVVTSAEQVVQKKLRVPLPIAVYRYSIDYGDEGWNHDKADSIGTAITLAGMLNVFLRHDQVFTVIYEGLNSRGFNALLKVPSVYELPAEERFALNTFGEVLATYGQYLQGMSLTIDYGGAGATITKAYYRSPALGRLPSSDRVALLSMGAALDASGGQMLVYIASRSLAERVVVHLTVSHVAPAALDASVLIQSVQADSLSTDGYTGIGRITPHGATRNLLTAPPADDAYRFDLTVERNSFTAFVFTAGS